MQRHFSKFLFANKFHPLSGAQGLASAVKLLDKFFFCKLDICITENKKKYIQDHFHTNIRQQKDCLKKPRWIKFIVNPKTG